MGPAHSTEAQGVKTMSNLIQNRSRRSFIPAYVRKATMLILPLGLAMSGLVQHAQAQPSSCSAALADLMAQWNQVG